MDVPTIPTMASTDTSTKQEPQPRLSREFFLQLKQVKSAFIEDVQPSIKRHRYFVGEGERERHKHRSAISSNRRNFRIKFSPFALTLGHGVETSRPTPRASLPPGITPVFRPRPITQPDQVVSTFVIAIVQSEPPLYVVQKIQRKAAIGFPGGGIEPGETILQTAAREFCEETCGRDKSGGVNISRYNPICIGKFVLNRADNGEQGAVVLVEIPEAEKGKIVAGGGDQEGELVEEVYFLTFEDLFQATENETILPNARKVWQIYLDHLVS